MRGGPKHISHAATLEVGMKGWIMDGIAREAAASISLDTSILYTPTRRIHLMNVNRLWDIYRLKKFSSILFMHFRPFFRFCDNLQGKHLRVFITHIDPDKSFDNREIELLNRSERIIFQNRQVLESAVLSGLSPDKCLIGHGAVSDKEFFPSNVLNDSSYILISGECKPRKNPNLLLNVILHNPDLQFLIHGKGWDQFFKNQIPKNLSLTYFDRARHPELVRNASALLSLSLNEGGPFPVLEALASGTPVISTRTGFASEVVSKDAGIVLGSRPDVEEISSAIRSTMSLKTRVFDKNLLPVGHDWKTFARTLYLS